MAPAASPVDDAASDAALRRAHDRSRWLKTLLQWHWISSAVSLVGLLLFAATGLTLNHAGQLEAKPATVNRQLQLPPALQEQLRDESRHGPAGVPAPLREWLRQTQRIELPASLQAEWSEAELYVAMPRPGGDAWLRIGLKDGASEYEVTDRGWVAYLNDLHKGRNAGAAWGWFIDAFALACAVFAITGLLILKLHAAHRPTIWPIVALGLVLPLLIAILFIH